MSDTQTDGAPADGAAAQNGGEENAASTVNGAEAAVDAWVLETIHNSPISHDTSVFNHFTTVALPDLKRRLKEIV